MVAVSLLAACRLFETYELDTAAPSPRVVGRVHDIATEAPVAGVQVCVWERPRVPCATTGAEGDYALEDVPLDEEVAIEFRSDSYRPALHATVVDSGGGEVTLDYPMFDEAVLAAYTALGGITDYDPLLGVAGVQAQDGTGIGVAGVVLSIQPDEGAGPVYLRADGLPDAGLLATEEGMAAWANLPAGTYEFTASWPLGACTPDDRSWRSASGRTRILVVDGHAGSAFPFRCVATE